MARRKKTAAPRGGAARREDQPARLLREKLELWIRAEFQAEERDIM